MLVTDDFDLQMLNGDTIVSFQSVDLEVARKWVKDATEIGRGPVSAIRHAGVASLISYALGCRLAPSCIDVRLDTPILVGQYIGPQLPEGTLTNIPEGAKIVWWMIDPM